MANYLQMMKKYREYIDSYDPKYFERKYELKNYLMIERRKRERRMRLAAKDPIM